ncbi:myo-inositol-1(or 4)-monophosphatase [Shimia marina]|uniref:Inositol-1-monophosphatase n=1 Tax=Shimia marina TaxID=321267 RepID=A0A0P1EQI6_9RHOB|nr:Inositol-1-monophosphatase [Shimia marina]SFE72100.1 myo-inositol-1(or 4)-monophosphatase [Shimia marina]
MVASLLREEVSDLSSRCRELVAIAHEAGELALGLRRDLKRSSIQSKGPQDFVSDADLATERFIRNRIAEVFPEEAVLGEEGGATGDGVGLWIIDPIDGTTNYLHGLEDWAVSIAFADQKGLACGAIVAPALGISVWAERGVGAYCKEGSLVVSGCGEAAHALLLLGRSERAGRKSYLRGVERTLELGMEYRRVGSAAVSLLQVCMARAEGYIEAHLNPWDVAAGLLVAREAGAIVHAPNFAELVAQGGPVCVAAPGVCPEVERVFDVMISG